jgi:hypothetical protein
LETTRVLGAMMKKVILLVMLLIPFQLFSDSFSGVYILDAPISRFIPKVRVISEANGSYLLQLYDLRHSPESEIIVGKLVDGEIHYYIDENLYIIRWEKEGEKLLEYCYNCTSESGDNPYRKMTDKDLFKLAEYGLTLPGDYK